MADCTDHYRRCTLCPRECAADRHTGTGACGCSDSLRAARAGLHFYEEPYLSGEAGSGTVFFSGCPLKCVFCQNAPISRGNAGLDISVERLCGIFFEQKARGALNINLVTGTHFTPSIAQALRQARERGLGLPVVWNSSGYEKPQTLALLSGLVDIWLPDFKTMSPENGARWFNAPDYPEVAGAALDFMVADAPEPVFDGPLMKRGVAVRHLVMPDAVADTKKVLRYLHDTYGDAIWISLMSQYTPPSDVPCPELRRPVSAEEYARAVRYAERLGITRCLIQEGDAVGESFIPAFDGEGIAAPD